MGMGIGASIVALVGIGIFAWLILRKRRTARTDRTIVPLTSGGIANENDEQKESEPNAKADERPSKGERPKESRNLAPSFPGIQDPAEVISEAIAGHAPTIVSTVVKPEHQDAEPLLPQSVQSEPAQPPAPKLVNLLTASNAPKTDKPSTNLLFASDADAPQLPTGRPEKENKQSTISIAHAAQPGEAQTWTAPASFDTFAVPKHVETPSPDTPKTRLDQLTEPDRPAVETQAGAPAYTEAELLSNRPSIKAAPPTSQTETPLPPDRSAQMGMEEFQELAPTTLREHDAEKNRPLAQASEPIAAQSQAIEQGSDAAGPRNEKSKAAAESRDTSATKQPTQSENTTPPPKAENRTTETPKIEPTPPNREEAASQNAALADDESQKPASAQKRDHRPPDHDQPSRYRPAATKALKPKSSRANEKGSNRSTHPLEIRVRAAIQRHGCKFTLLAERPIGAPPEIEAESSQNVTLLFESGDERWYEVDASDLSASLSGMLLVSQHGASVQYRWQISSRDLHLLSFQQGFPGPVSTSRMQMNAKHVVLCRNELIPAVQQALLEAGCGGIAPGGVEAGAPQGWSYFWPATPTQTAPPLPGNDILNILRPQPELEFLLEGGIWLSNNRWLAGYPPTIRTTGVRPDTEPVRIDGEIATHSPDAGYTTPGYADATEHPHQLWCAGITKTYSIIAPSPQWDRWDAHGFPSGNVCGAIGTTRRDQRWKAVTVPSTNPVLIGEEPGQIFHCPIQPGDEWTGFVPFDPVWAVPLDPLHCDRNVCGIILLSGRPPKKVRVPSAARARSRIRSWSQAIRNCRRKGLKLADSTELPSKLWFAYLAEAKALRRAMKDT
jgi:hypothetical protein